MAAGSRISGSTVEHDRTAAATLHVPSDEIRSDLLTVAGHATPGTESATCVVSSVGTGDRVPIARPPPDPAFPLSTGRRCRKQDRAAGSRAEAAPRTAPSRWADPA